MPEVLIRDPDTMIHLKAEGEIKEFTRYWRGAVRDGDVEVFDTPPNPVENVNNQVKETE
jgi:hypothetical protein